MRFRFHRLGIATDYAHKSKNDDEDDGNKNNKEKISLSVFVQVTNSHFGICQKYNFALIYLLGNPTAFGDKLRAYSRHN